jgi:hypothetical protein
MSFIITKEDFNRVTVRDFNRALLFVIYQDIDSFRIVGILRHGVKSYCKYIDFQYQCIYSKMDTRITYASILLSGFIL